MRPKKPSRQAGIVAVEAALVLPILLLLMIGVWEVGRLVQVQQLLVNGVREGARAAAGGTINGTPVTVATVEQVTLDYLRAAGLPEAAADAAIVTLTNVSANPWTDPVDAEPLDRFEVAVLIPPGAAFDALRLSMLSQITDVRSLTSTVVWTSANDLNMVVDATIPF